MNTCKFNDCGLPIPKGHKYCGNLLDSSSCTSKAQKEMQRLNREKNKGNRPEREWECAHCGNMYRSKHKHMKGLCGHVNFRTGCAWKYSFRNPNNIESKKVNNFKPKYFLRPNYRTGEVLKYYYDEGGELQLASK